MHAQMHPGRNEWRVIPATLYPSLHMSSVPWLRKKNQWFVCDRNTHDMLLVCELAYVNEIAWMSICPFYTSIKSAPVHSAGLLSCSSSLLCHGLLGCWARNMLSGSTKVHGKLLMHNVDPENEAVLSSAFKTATQGNIYSTILYSTLVTNSNIYIYTSGVPSI